MIKINADPSLVQLLKTPSQVETSRVQPSPKPSNSSLEENKNSNNAIKEKVQASLVVNANSKNLSQLSNQMPSVILPSEHSESFSMDEKERAHLLHGIAPNAI